jgi:hypothetical protein
MISRYLRHLLILTLLISTTACSTLQRVQKLEVFSTPVERAPIPMQPPPAPVKLRSVEWYVVTEDTYDDFKEKLVNRQGLPVWYSITVNDYENLSINLEELRRYIIEQQQLLRYYEKAITEDSEELNAETE